MQIGQIGFEGGIVAAIFEGGLARPIPKHSMLELIQRSESESVPLPELASLLASRLPIPARPLIPISPSEVYGCGVTYEQSASFRDAEQGTREGMYAAVYHGARPEIFFKGTARVCPGPGEMIGIRSDSKFTAPEPELALVLGKRGHILGYTLANDVSAWDIERENSLYLPQSKTFNACCSLGPVIVTVDSIPDPYNLQMICRITRGAEVRFEGCVSTSKLNRKFEILIDFLFRANDIPTGAVVLTGTGIIVTEAAALAPGDIVSIQIPEIGELTNIARAV
jgi:2-dehydro-3-deoxy-D-arabinonate dehydratase